MPRMIRDLVGAVGMNEVRVSRSYRLELPPSASAACYVQGVNEATHGISDSLLSVLAARAGDIASDLVNEGFGLQLATAA
jgi:L-ornithine N5-oxygenase